MKRFICLVCLLALLLSACSRPEPPTPTVSPENDTHGIYQLNFYTERLTKDPVGNEWIFTYTYNGETIQNGHKIIYNLGVFSFLTIEVEVRELDKIDDVGNAAFQIALCDGGSGQTHVTVTESSGCYKGHTALWKIGCNVKLIDKTSPNPAIITADRQKACTAQRHTLFCQLV